MTPPVRTPSHRYRDPVDEIWIVAAKKLGLDLERTDAAFATYDGQGVLAIARREHLDADDSLAQLILHELCHALVGGPDAMRQPDWGMCDGGAADRVREHACQRLQAALGQAHGLRAFMAPTTEHRAYYEALPVDPLAPGADPAIALAREGWLRARRGLWAETLERALGATARVAAIVRPFTQADSLWGTPSELHASGFPLGADVTRTCGGCAWMFTAGPGRPVARCRQTRHGEGVVARRVESTAQACVRWEPKFGAEECKPCGACCREGFDLAPVRRGERITRLHPELVRRDVGAWVGVPRPGGRCLALVGTGVPDAPYRCRVYEDRPRACAEMEVAGDGCLAARRRVGLSV